MKRGCSYDQFMERFIWVLIAAGFVGALWAILFLAKAIFT